MSWINPAGGDWSTAANWLGGVVPNGTQDAIINISVSGPITINSANAVQLADGHHGQPGRHGRVAVPRRGLVHQSERYHFRRRAGLRGQPDGWRHLERIRWQSDRRRYGDRGRAADVDRRHDERLGDHSGPGRPATGRQRRNPYDESLDARTLQNAGSATWASTDEFYQSANSIFQNLAHATLTVQSGVTWNAVGGTLDNQYQATVTVVAGTGTASFDGFFTDEGDLDVSSGTLVMGADGNVTGNVEVAAGATLQFGGTQYVFNSGAGLTGFGTVTFGTPLRRPGHDL